MEKEIYKRVKLPEFEHLYEVSNLGNVRSIKTGKILKTNTQDNYNIVYLFNKKTKVVTVHRLVALTFIKNPQKLPIVAHRDKNRLNDNVRNLKFVSKSESIRLIYEIYVSYPVVKCDRRGHEIERFETIEQAAVATRIKSKRIIRFCRGGAEENVGGFCWHFDIPRLRERERREREQ